MLTARLDHLVVAATSLQQGRRYIHDNLGVEIPAGGEHPQMGTHNCLMQLSQNSYLEVIAINPDAPTPSHPRWFGLDDPHVRSSLNQGPLMLTWLVNCADISSLRQSGYPGITSVAAMRRDHLKWQITIPKDGHLNGAGILPSVIQWNVSPHPAGNMTDLGCSLTDLEIHHPYAEWVRQELAKIGAEELVKLLPLAKNSAPFMVAHLQTPIGPRSITSRRD